jgi:ATP-dependent helicase/nuclease subunit A
VVDIVNQVMGQAAQSDNYPGFRPHTTDSAQVGLVCKLPQTLRPARTPNPTDDGIPAEITGWRDSLRTPRELPEDSLRVQEARQAAAWIAQQLSDWQAQGKDMGAANVMVLSRKRAGLLPLQDELRHLQIAAHVGDKCDLIECCEVQDVVALLDVLVSPQHDLSLARALKSPLFNLDDSALVSLALARRDEPLPWFELLQKLQLKTYDGRWVAADLIRWKGWLDTLPPHDALQAIYSDGDVLARFAVAAPPSQRDTVLANLRAVLGVSLQLGGGRYATPYAFVRALKAGGVLAPPVVASQAVRLLTVHGAKGLEAHTVLLLDTDSPERKAETMGVLVDWPGESPAPVRFVFLASESQPPACAADALSAERREREREELNTLYVAMTRARHTLAISSIEPYQASGRSWWSRLEPLADEVALVDQAPSQALHQAPAPLANGFDLKVLPLGPPRVVSADAQTGAPAVAVGPEALSQIEPVLARLGLAMHRLLEWGERSAPAVRAAAQEFGLDAEQGAQAAAMAEAILHGEGAWAWDPQMLSWAGNEVTLVYCGQTLRLDRLVQRRDPGHAGHWWVLDYKSSAAPLQQPALVAQLRQYQKAVQSAYPADVVHAAFLTARGAMVVLEKQGEF